MATRTAASVIAGRVSTEFPGRHVHRPQPGAAVGAAARQVDTAALAGDPESRVG